MSNVLVIFFISERDLAEIKMRRPCVTQGGPAFVESPGRLEEREVAMTVAAKNRIMIHGPKADGTILSSS
jgi:hypothetical protein